MKSLGAKFSDKQLEDMREVSDSLGVSISALSRAALRMGVASVKAAMIKNKEKAKDLVLVNDARAK